MGIPRLAPRLPQAFVAIAATFALACVPFISSIPAASASPGVVIRQVYSGGQSNGAPFQHDYVELFNTGSVPVLIDGWSVQYASAGGNTWHGTTLNGTIPPGGFYLIQESGGTTGLTLPVPDAAGTLSFAAGGGRIALVDTATPLSCGASPGCASAPGVVDFVGYGGAVSAEGAAAAQSPGPENALVRAGNGCIDTDNNSADFTLTQPAPHSSAAPPQLCTPGGTPGIVATPVGQVRIHDIQGSAHRSPLVGQTVTSVPGIVTSTRSNGFWMQDPQPDSDDATSEGILVFLNAQSPVQVGDSVLVTGLVAEFRPGGQQQLSITEITQPNITVVASNEPLPAAVELGPAGRMPPTEIIEDDASPDAEVGGVFEPATDGLDFWESLEGMRVEVDGAVITGPAIEDRGRVALPVLAANGSGATGITPRGGIAISSSSAGLDFNPELIFLDSSLLPSGQSFPEVSTGDKVTSPVIGVVDYAFGRYQVLPSDLPAFTPGGLQPEVANSPALNELSIATFNVENLHPGELPDKFARLAEIIVYNLAAPDLVVLEEMQDNTGPTDNGVVAADSTANLLIAAISTAGGPTYQYRDIAPVDGQDGGQPGGNIRVGFLFRTDRGLAFVDESGGSATTGVDILPGGNLSHNPGRILPDSAHATVFDNSRKPLVGEFTYDGHTIFVIGNHFTSRQGSSSLFGRLQPPDEGGKAKRLGQAEVVANFVADILAEDPQALVIVVGDLNDFPFSAPLATLQASGLQSLVTMLPPTEQYTYVFQGNSQVLDHMLVSPQLATALVPNGYDVVHVNAEFADQASDHDPQVARFSLAGP